MIIPFFLFFWKFVYNVFKLKPLTFKTSNSVETDFGSIGTVMKTLQDINECDQLNETLINLYNYSETKCPKWSNIMNSLFKIKLSIPTYQGTHIMSIKQVWIMKGVPILKRNHKRVMFKTPHLHTVAGLLIHSPLDMNNNNFHQYYYSSENNLHWVDHIHWYLIEVKAHTHTHIFIMREMVIIFLIRYLIIGDNDTS